MKVYAIEEFTRDDECCEHESRVISVHTVLNSAIQEAREHAINNVSYYGYMREDKAEGCLKYYCCLDSDPTDEAEYPKYMTITVTEHELKER